MTKLTNPISTITLGGELCRVGFITVGASLEIEAFLATLESPFERFERSGLATKINKDRADQILDDLAQNLEFWPPDAIGALCDKKFLKRGDFGKVFVGAMVRAYNPHMSPEEVDRIAIRTTVIDVHVLQSIALGSDSDPKDENGLGVAESPPTQARSNESTGDE